MREWKFAADLVVRTLHFCCGEHRFSPWLGNLRPASHAVWPQIKKKKEEDEGDETSELRGNSANDLLQVAEPSVALTRGPCSFYHFILPLLYSFLGKRIQVL